MKVYSRRRHRNIEIKVHFGVGNGTHTACGMDLFSRHIMVSVWGDWDGTVITDQIERVTCKRCLATKDTRLRRLLSVESACPGIFDRNSLCGEEWLLHHALDVSKGTVDSQWIDVSNGARQLILTNGMKSQERKNLLTRFVAS